MTNPKLYTYQDPVALSRWLRAAMYASIVLSIVGVISGGMQVYLLQGFMDGTYMTQQEAVAVAEANDQREGVVGFTQVALFLVGAVLLLRWTHRMNANARALGAADMEFTPGWAVGWHFVPVFQLWKPYQAMQEIWRASCNPLNPAQVFNSSLVRWWWGLWILMTSLSNIGAQIAMAASNPGKFQLGTSVIMLSDLAMIPLCLVFLKLAETVEFEQARWRGQHEAAQPEDDTLEAASAAPKS